MIKKDYYTPPEVDVFTVQTEGVICESTGVTSVPDWQDGTDFPITF